MLERLFKLREHGTTASREFFAGFTTFLTMGYIIFVNPDILGQAGMPKDALVTVTVWASVVGTTLVGLWANVPFAMAPGMGLNAFFTFALVKGQGLPWQTALGVVFLSGLVFLVLTLAGIREKVVAAIPLSLRLASAGGIGLFITFIGFKSMGLVVANPATLVSLGPLTPTVWIGLGGLLLMGILEVRKVRGAILISVIVTTIAAMLLGYVEAPSKVVGLPPSPAPLAFKLDILAALKGALLAPIFSMMFVDLFDSVGTIVACSQEAGMVDKDGRIPKIDRILEADAIATVAGALLGTSTTTTYIESGSGIAEGGRTGLTAVSVSFFFLLALFFTPLIGIVPSYATAPALVGVGVFMFQSIRHINFADFEEAVPAFMTIVLMPLTYSISNGLVFGFLSYIVIALASGDWRKVNPVLWVIGALSLLQLLITAGLIS
jgi:AGZA family xanthine/uracil permease-like MFS transporter